MLSPDDRRRVEAERAVRWLTGPEGKTALWRYENGTDEHGLHHLLTETYLAGDAAGYARALADLQRLAVHYEETANDEVPRTPTTDAISARLRYLAAGLYGAAERLQDGWRCTDPTHTRCLEKEADND